MAKYESSIKVVKATVDAIYTKLSDFSRLEGLMPPQMIKEWEATADECHFTVDKIGRVGFRIAEKNPVSMIKYVLEASMPLGINMFVQLKEAPDDASESRLKITMTAEIPLMLRPLVGSKLQEVVDKMAESMSQHLY